MTVFLLGAGVMQEPAIACAHELGWKVAAADGNPGAPGAASCDRFFPVDLKDREGLLAAALEIRGTLGLDAVFTAGTDFSANVAWLADRLGLPGHRPEAAAAASDKLLMRARFEAAGLPSPRFAECIDREAFLSSAFLNTMQFPLVVKPADNMGARGCRLVRDREALAAALAAALPLSRTHRAIVEEYVDGPEFSVDALVHRGQIEIRGFADRHIAFSPYFVELGHTMPSAIDADRRESVLDVFRKAVTALGLTHGAAKGDMKWSPSRGGPVIGEIAARLSGGYMSGWTYPYASGVDLTRDALLLAAGLEPSAPPADRGWTSTERAFISIPGKVAAIDGLRAARLAPFVKELFLRATPGDEVVFPSNNVEKCGNVISQAPDAVAATRAADEAARGILVRLEAPNPATEAFLRGGDREAGMDGQLWPPPAFDVDAALHSAIERLPPGGGKAEDGRPIAVFAPEGIDGVEARDWLGRGFAESAKMALGAGGGFLVPAEATPPAVSVGKAFWMALVAGGTQGALYVLDCIRRGAPLP